MCTSAHSTHTHKAVRAMGFAAARQLALLCAGVLQVGGYRGVLAPSNPRGDVGGDIRRMS